MADVLGFFGKIFILKLITNKINFLNKLIF